MKKKNPLVLPALILLIVLLCFILYYVFYSFQKTGLVTIAQWEEVYDYNGKLLLSEKDESALLLKTLGRTEFEKIEKKEIDLTPFGFEGKTFSYYPVTVDQGYGIVKTTLYPSDASYEGFWPVLNDERIVYIAENGEKYAIHPKENLCYPIFSDSIDGVDVYGKDVIAFSANGSYALALSENSVTVYHTDPMDDSLRIVDVKEVSLKGFGESFSFGAFVGDSQAYFYTEKENALIALDCAEGKVAKSLLAEGEYGKTISRFYAQKYENDQKDSDRVFWSHLLLGEEFKSAKLKENKEIKLFAVSPSGSYAVGGDKSGEVFVLGEKDYFSLTSFLEDGETLENAEFIYENLIYVKVKTAENEMISRCCRICF
ncbi:MAG: hypothetical protein IKU24_00450 [Clostridia bacterium]|nr:hypothetical protein [Clostridia bacterium]